MSVTVFNNFLIYHTIHFLTYTACNMLIFEKSKTGLPGGNLRSTGDNYAKLTRAKYYTKLGFSGERHNALTPCLPMLSVFRIQTHLFFCRSFHVHTASPAFWSASFFRKLISAYSVGGGWSSLRFCEPSDCKATESRVAYNCKRNVKKYV